MRKLTALLLAMLAAITLFTPAFAQAEAPQHVTITLTSRYGEKPTVTIRDEAFLHWLQSLLTVDAPAAPLPYRPANDVYEIAFSGSDVRVYTVTYNDLDNLARVQLPGGSVHEISINVPEMLNRAVFERLSFDVPEAHRSLLHKNGWTVAFRHPHMPLMLPQKLEASRTDASALHFTWADLFLQDAGYDLRPYLGKAVIPYVYALYETMPRAAFYTDDGSDVRCPMYAVVLEFDGQVIGSYLFACSLDGSNLMSLKGNAAPALLKEESIRDYLLARLPMTAQERELAALTPEEVIIRYGKVNDPMLTDIRVLLLSLGSGSSQIFSPLALMPIPKGQTVTVTRKVWEDDMATYEIERPQGLYFPQVVHESPETGWKVNSFYNTGM